MRKFSYLSLMCVLGLWILWNWGMAIDQGRSTGGKAVGVNETLKLYPGNVEALALKKKTQACYGPGQGDVVTNSIGMKLVWIPPGELMTRSRDLESEAAGDSEGQAKWYADEHPQQRVKISKGFYMGIYEVTQGQYKAIMGKNPSRLKGHNLPVETVSWNEAVEFCEKLSRKEAKTYRLPTEAEWEYACRAGTTTPFYTGQTISTDQANYDGDYVYGDGREGVHREKTTEVGSFQPNAFGLYDMHGNVWEWCSDWHDKDFYSESGDFAVGTKNTTEDSVHILRGGSWIYVPGLCRFEFREWRWPARQGVYLGFRVVVMDF